MIVVLEELDDLMGEFGVDALLLSGISLHNPNLYFVTQFLTVDNVHYVKMAGEEPVLAATDLVCERARRNSPMRHFHSLSPIFRKAVQERLPPRARDKLIAEELARELLPRNGVVGIPRQIDAQLIADLRSCGVQTKPVEEIFLRARETKSSDELRRIRLASRATEATFERVVEVVQNAEVGPNRVLIYDGEPLTVGRVKRIIEHSLVDNDSENSQECIVVGGRKGADYHYLGRRGDRLRSQEPIIVDIYPRRIEERYHADITRTLVRGNVGSRLRQLIEDVEAALGAVVDAVSAGVTAQELVDVMADSLEGRGHPVVHRTPGTKEGMLHGLGHGIGLDVHEMPHLGPLPYHLRKGSVIAVEPGLYYKRIGGVRIEDDLVVESGRARTITRIPHTYFL